MTDATTPTVPFPEAARVALADTQLRHNLGNATHDDPRQARRRRSPRCPTGRSCARPAGRSRSASSATSTRYLLELEASVTRAGGDGPLGARRRRGERDRRAISSPRTARPRSSSQVADDRGDAAQRGARRPRDPAWETDLAELIIQLAGDRPSHILVPAIHKNRAEIRDLFLRTLGDAHRRPLRRPARARRRRAAPPARAVPARQGRDQRRQLRRRRDRHGRRRRVRGQRADVPDVAARC